MSEGEAYFARDVSVFYGRTVALDRVSIAVEPGEIHALLGENGAGKTTLADVLGGLRRPDSGQIRAPARIGHVHQHFAIPPGIRASEALVAGEPGFRFLSRGALNRAWRSMEARTGLDLGDPDAEAASLPVGARQRLEFARAVSEDPELLILDEPTAVLAPPEVESFARSVRRAAHSGAAVLFVTHRLAEVFDLADRITLLRTGRVVLSCPAGEVTRDRIAAEFVGEVAFGAPGLPQTPGGDVLVVEDLTVRGPRGEAALSGLGLKVAAGEVVAVVGVDGNGQNELVRAIVGLLSPESGRILLAGRPVAERGLRRSGGAVIPGDRQREGLILDFTVRENLRLAEPFAPVSPAEARERLSRFDVRASSPESPVRALSGGNRQKVVLARELSRRPFFVLAVSPTRGLDLAATAATLRALCACAADGAAVLLVTTDLEEARSAARRIHILFRGGLTGPFPADAPAALVGARMAGIA